MRENQPSRAQSANWALVVEGMDVDITFLKDFVIPSTTIGVTEIPVPADNRILRIPGDRIVFDDLQVEFFVDSKFKNLRRMSEWVRNNTNEHEPITRNVTVHLLDGDGKWQGVAIEFRNAWPFTVSPLPLDSENATTNMVYTASMNYSDMVWLDEAEAVKTWTGER